MSLSIRSARGKGLGRVLLCVFRHAIRCHRRSGGCLCRAVSCSWQMTVQVTLTAGEISSLSAGSASRWPRMVATALKLTLPTL